MLSLLHNVLLCSTLTIPATAFVLHPQSQQQQQQQQYLSPFSTISPNKRRMQQYEKPKWLNEAMGDNSFSSSSSEEYPKPKSLTPGISGFAIDPNVGFVAILKSSTLQKFLTTIVSTQDRKSQVESAEALTMVQLAGGLDLGTAILPPDALLDLVREEEEEQDGKRMRVTLTKITVLPNDNVTDNDESSNEIESAIDSIESTPEREEAIQNSSPKVLVAIQKLPNLSSVTIENVQNAMQIFSDEKGTLNRENFGKVLDALRKELNKTPTSQYKFILNVNVLNQDSVQTISIESVDVVKVLGLSMRHKVQIEIDESCFEGKEEEEEEKNDEATVENVYKQYPAFRPIQELYEDAKVMDGFIPSMFQQAQKQQQQQQQQKGLRNEDENGDGGFE